MSRSADTVFHRRFSVPYTFDEISERGALKLTSVLRVTAPRHFDLWRSEIGGPDFFEKTGLFIPIVAFDLFVTDHPIHLGADFEVDITIRLGRQLDDRGAVRRLLSESVGEVHSIHSRTGERVLVARNIKHNVMSRNDTDPAVRRVTELPPSMNLGSHPERVLSFPSVSELCAPPEDGSQVASFADSEPRVWSYQQTDMNRHIHAMEYVRMLDLFATRHLAALDYSPRDHLIERARVAFRKPCFTGEEYRCAGRLFSAPGDAPMVVCAMLYQGATTTGDPAVATRMYVRRRD